MNGSAANLPSIALPMTIERAREIVASPDLNSGSEILAACKLLFEHGNDGDRQGVLALQRAGIVAGFEQSTKDAGRANDPQRSWSALFGFYLLFAATIGSVIVAYCLIQAAMAVLP